MMNSTFGFLPSHSALRKRRLRTSRLQVESLEDRRVLAASVSGIVVVDADNDGTIDTGEAGQSGVVVYVDANNNNQFDQVGSIIEPDQTASGVAINSSAAGVTLSVAMNDNSISTADGPVKSFDDDFTSTGDRVFGYGEGAGTHFFHTQRRLRMDFSAPVSSVAIDFIAERPPNFVQQGILLVYDSAGTLLGQFESSELQRKRYETLSVSRGQADISYAVAYTSSLNLLGRFDNLRVNGEGTEKFTITGSDGQYTLDGLAAGTYPINEVAPNGYTRTVPSGVGATSVTVTADQQATGTDFANGGANQGPVAVDDTATTRQNTNVDINVLQNDTDDQAIDPSKLVITQQPQHGTLDVNTTSGVVTFKPASGYKGTDTFRYTVADGDNVVSNEATVNITVQASGWQNQTMPMDVSGDGAIVPLDVLLIINELNEPTYRDAETGLLPVPPEPVPFFFDVDGDGFATATDAILIINFLNEQSEASGEAPADAPAASNVSNSDIGSAIAADNATAKRRSIGPDEVDAALAS